VVHRANCAVYHGLRGNSPNKNGRPLHGGH